MNIDEVRKLIPVVNRKMYLDNAGTGPPPLPVISEMSRFLDEWSSRGEFWEDWLQEIVESRRLFAELIGGSVDEVACVPNVTSALVAVASTLNYDADANVVVSELNFPTNVYVWQAMRARGVIEEVRLLGSRAGAIPLEGYEKAIDDKTAIVSIDHVSWLNGCREHVKEIGELAHEHGSLLMVDSFHSTGVMPVDVKRDGIDALACGAYKWLMGPHGVAFLYVRRDLLDGLKPTFIGWHGVKDSVMARVLRGEDPFKRPFDLEEAIPSPSATRFEWGSWSPISVIGAKAALKFTLDTDPRNRYERIMKLTDSLIEGLKQLGLGIVSPLEDDRRSGIVSFEVEDAQGLVAKLARSNIAVSARMSTVRVSPHFYNTEDEIDRFVENLGKLISA